MRLVGVKLDLESKVASVFAYKIATMNLVPIAKFFDITYKTVLLSLFVSEYCDSGLLEPISTYFGTVETNSCGILHLYYLFWLKEVLHLPTALCAKIRENEEFCMRLLVFLEYIIKCSVKDDFFSNILHHIYLNGCKTNIIEDFLA